jgi:hypothetical protein
MEFPTTDLDDIIDIISKYTAKVKVVSMPSGAMTGHVMYGNTEKSIMTTRFSEDAVLRCMYKMIMDDMIQECFIIEKFNPVMSHE